MVTLVSYTPNVVENILGAMSKCYEKKVSLKGLQHCIDAGHLSVLEHGQATFDIECSLAVLGQITRHRHLSFTVKSTRGANFEKKFYIPEKIKNSDFHSTFLNTISRCMSLYQSMIDDGIPHEDAAYILPKGIITKLRVTGNLRAWFEYLPKRLCKRAMPEHRKIAEAIHVELSKAIPEIFFRDFMNCANCREKSCSFH